MKKYKFKGTDTQRRIKYEAQGDTPLELYDELVMQNVISIVDGDPCELALMTKYGKSCKDFLDENNDYNYEKYIQWTDTVKGLTDEEVLDVISNERGNAYYNTIKKYNEESGEYEEVEY